MSYYRGKGFTQSNTSGGEWDIYFDLLEMSLPEKPRQDLHFMVEDGERDFVTRPDLTFQICRVLVYLDGPPHLKGHIERRDKRITEYMTEKRGFKVLRFPYKPPLSKKQRLDILEKIRAAVVEASDHFDADRVIDYIVAKDEAKRRGLLGVKL